MSGGPTSLILWAALSALLLAFTFRERGQDHDWLGTTGARVFFWALPVGIVVYVVLSAPNWEGAWMAVLAGAMAYLGLLPPHGAVQYLTEASASDPAQVGEMVG